MWWIEPALVFGRHYAAKFKKPLMYAAAALALTGGGFAAGWTANENRHAVAAQDRAEVQVVAVVEEAVARDEAVRTVYVQDLAATRKLEAERDRLRTENATLQERMTLYVPENAGPDGSGFVPVGAVRLLDDAALGSAASASPASPTPVGEGSAPSDVSWLRLTQHTVKISGLYNDAALQCNALIDWVDTHVVNKPNQ